MLGASHWMAVKPHFIIADQVLPVLIDLGVATLIIRVRPWVAVALTAIAICAQIMKATRHITIETV